MKFSSILAICAIGVAVGFSIITFFVSIAFGLSVLKGFSGRYQECVLAPTPKNASFCQIDVAKPELSCNYPPSICPRILAQHCPYETYGECPAIPFESSQHVALGVVIILAGAGGSFALAFYCIFGDRCDYQREDYEEIP